jgi:hypothetical protein
VFPCQARDKRPATVNGLKDAKRDESVIRRAWTQKPDLNVAVRTGRESGIFVLDVDGEEGFDSLHELERLHGDLPPTLSVTTPRGGQHFYFVHPGVEIRNTAGYPGHGLDVRGDGGYVLAPPSVGPAGRRYEVDERMEPVQAPQWLLKLLVDRQRAEVAQIGTPRDWGKFVSEGATEGDRNTRMTSYVGHLFNHGHDAEEVLALALVLNKNVRPPLPDRDVRKIVESINRRRAA